MKLLWKRKIFVCAFEFISRFYGFFTTSIALFRRAAAQMYCEFLRNKLQSYFDRNGGHFIQF